MENHKILVVYFSRPDENYNVGTVETGNTEILAKKLAESLNADIFAIVPEKPYPTDYQGCIAVATDERDQDARPAYIGEIDNWSEYDTIFLGYPIWWGDLPMIVYTFIENHDFTGKTVFPFNTHEGSGNAGTYDTLKEKLNGATVSGDGFNISGIKARTEDGVAKIIDWASQQKW
ncbi:NAD(P)H-dependent oxidoreductase [Candidatus Saccharibacteria bacterium]|nr:NAD(P)H-dependent oxidoreductase [Candidatus Saccharibacteria bacterium]